MAIEFKLLKHFSRWRDHFQNTCTRINKINKKLIIWKTIILDSKIWKLSEEFEARNLCELQTSEWFEIAAVPTFGFASIQKSNSEFKTATQLAHAKNLVSVLSGTGLGEESDWDSQSEVLGLRFPVRFFSRPSKAVLILI